MLILPLDLVHPHLRPTLLHIPNNSTFPAAISRCPLSHPRAYTIGYGVLYHMLCFDIRCALCN
jgi:hypothetical protein